jgi:methionyl-tRNA formyltransferase
MKIVFMGTPGFAAGSLKALTKTRHTICAVVTIPDKAQGRGLKVKPPAVKQFAVQQGLPVLQPEDLKDIRFIESLKKYDADCFVVVAFKILPKEIFSIPKSGTVNVHASLLPLYRGAAPINWAIMNGENKTGVTTMFINSRVDTGDILKQKEVAITEEMTAGELHDILMETGAQLLVDTLALIEKNEIKPIIQDDLHATKAPKINDSICLIDFEKPARIVHNQIRGLSPYPSAFTYLNSKKVKIYKSKVYTEDFSGSPGSLKVISGKLIVACHNGAVEIIEIQIEGKKRLSVKDFLNGRTIYPGDKFSVKI